MMTSRAAVASRFLAFLGSRRIEYCVVGDVRRLPAEIHSDIDIVVDPRALQHLPTDLLEFCAGNELQLVQCLRHEVDAFYFVLSWLGDGGRPNFLHLDLCADYCRGGALFLTARELLAGRVEAVASNGTPKGFFVASPSRAFIYYLLKRVDKASLDERHGEFLSAEWHRDPVAALEGVHRFWTGAHARTIAEAADTGRWGMVVAALTELRRELRRRARRPHRGLGPELARRLGRVLRPTGVLIAMVGPDGSGKSTLAEIVVRDLAPAFRRTRSVHFRPQVGRRHAPGAPVTDPHGQPSRGFFGSVAKAAYYLCDFVVGYVWQVRPHLVRSTLFLFDRYVYDLEADSKRFRYGGPRSVLGIVRRFTPQPDLVILLDAPPDVLRARKPELPPAEVAQIAERYRRVVGGLPNGSIVDAARPIPEVAASVEAAVLRFMAARMQRRMRRSARDSGHLTVRTAGAS
jgi:thymidylate kinase